MARVHSHLVLKRDNTIVQILKEHIGIENAIKSSVLVKQLKERGFETNANSIHTIISKIISERALPIVSSPSFGYCWGSKKADFEIAINELEMKVAELNNRIDHLKKFIIK